MQYKRAISLAVYRASRFISASASTAPSAGRRPAGLIRGVLAALLLLAAAPLWAQAPTKVWSGTLTVKDLGTVRGCDDAQTANANKCESASSGALSDDDFTHGGGTYDIKTISLAEGSSPNALTLVFSRSLDAAGQQFVLVVGAQRFDFSSASATISTANNIADSQVVWSSGPALWNANASISLALYTSGSPVTLSPRPIALTEGEGAVTLTVTMNVAPTASVTWTPSIQPKNRSKVSVTPSSITFSTTNWSTHQTFSLSPADDDDSNDEIIPLTLLSNTQDGFYKISPGNSIRITDDEKSTDAFLRTLSISPGTLSPAFMGGTTAYTVEVPNSVPSVVVTPTRRDASAHRVTVDGTTILSGTSSIPILLDPGTPKDIVVVVTAEDETTTRTYTITVTRAGALPTGVELTFPDVLKVVNEATTHNTPSGTITASLVGGSFSETVTCLVTYPAADRAGITATGGFPTPADPDYNLVGNFLIPAKATDSTNGATIQVLADTTAEEPEVGAIAATCTAEGITLTSEFETFTILDNDTTPGRVSNLRLEPNFESLEASWEPPAGAETRGPVVEGYNVRYKLGTAPDQAATANDPTTGWVSHTTIYAATARTATIANDLTNFKVYDVQVRTTNEGGMGDWVGARGTPVASRDATLSDLNLAFTPLVINSVTYTYTPTSPFSFSPSRLNYALTVPQDVTELTVTPTLNVETAQTSVTVDGNPATSGQASSPSITLAEGSDKAIPIVVTAEDGTTKRTYTVTITRARVAAGLTLDVPNEVSTGTYQVRQGRSITITATLDSPAQQSGVEVSFTVGVPDDSRNTAPSNAFKTEPKPDPDTSIVTVTIPWGQLSGKFVLSVEPNAKTEESNTIVIGTAVVTPPLLPPNIVINIVPDLRVQQVHETILPEVARAVAGRATGAISARIEQVMTSGARAQASLGGQGTVAGALVAHAPDMVNGRRPWRNLLDGSNFVLPLNGNGGGGAGGSSVSMWGSGDYRNLSGESEGVEFDGNLLGAQIGVDAKLRNDLLAGAALSWSQGTLDYEDSGGSGATTTGDYEVDILGIHPYFGWHSGHNNFWATAGYGSGEVEVNPAGSEAASSDVSLWTVGAGGGGQVWSEGDSDIRLKAEVMSTEMTVDENDEMPESLTVNATLFRVAMQASRTEHLAGGGSRSPSLSLGVRHDGGDGNTGTGAEVGGSVRYDNPHSRVSASASVNLLVGRSDYEEWGISGMVQLSPGADGQGLSFILRPGYGGNAETSVGDTSRIWSQSMRDAADTTQNFDPQGRLEARLGYGLSASGERGGLLTPWGGMNLQEDARRYRVGLDWTSGGPLTMRLHGERREQTNSDASHAVVLKGEMRF